MRKWKNAILRIQFIVNIYVFMLCGSSLDSENYIPFVIGLIASFSWIILFLVANDRSLRGKRNGNKNRRKVRTRASRVM